jgi:hypothetical protein
MGHGTGLLMWSLAGCVRSGGVSTEVAAAPSAETVLTGTWRYAPDPRGGEAAVGR